MKLNKNENIAIYCTGGIRCEKALTYLKAMGYKRVFQLEGGIINYLKYKNQYKSKSNWQGECFVFDNRVSINKYLNRGKYLQCHGCRQPITYEDTKKNGYIKGVSCPHCFKKRTKKQKQRSLSREEQIKLAELRGQHHTFSRLTSKNIC